MRKSFITFCLSLALMPASLVPTATAQERRDKEQTYVLETPYAVEKIAEPTGGRVKNVIKAGNRFHRQFLQREGCGYFDYGFRRGGHGARYGL